jgi:hypothetical protein
MLQARPVEQPGFRSAVSCERAVVVEMIVREVREQRGMKSHARDAMLIQRVR